MSDQIKSDAMATAPEPTAKKAISPRKKPVKKAVIDGDTPQKETAKTPAAKPTRKRKDSNASLEVSADGKETNGNGVEKTNAKPTQKTTNEAKKIGSKNPTKKIAAKSPSKQDPLTGEEAVKNNTLEAKGKKTPAKALSPEAKPAKPTSSASTKNSSTQRKTAKTASKNVADSPLAAATPDNAIGEETSRKKEGLQATPRKGRSTKPSATKKSPVQAVSTQVNDTFDLVSPAPSALLPQVDKSVEVQGQSMEATPESFSEGTDNAVSSDKPASNRRRGRRSRGRGKKNSQLSADLAKEETGDILGEDQPVELSDVNSAESSENVAIKDADSEGENRKTEKTEPVQEAKARRKMFVSVLPDEQVEVVLCEEGQVQEYYVEMFQQEKVKGNIYKAVINNIDTNLQAAFVNYGAAKNGFLQIDEVHPEYYNTNCEQNKQRKYPPIQKVLKPGQELLVQIVKEPTGTKGAFLTTYLSMAGRYLVLTPGREQVGVSRKVDDEQERIRLREMLTGLNPGHGLGVIIRTVSMGTSKTNLQKDLQSLKKLWKEIRTHGTTDTAPSLIHQEMDLTTRAIRDYLTDQVTEVWIDDEKTAADITDLAQVLFPRKKNLVRMHKDENLGLFERFNVQRQLDQIYSREVVLPSGGRLVFDPTEALTAIDINSGRSGGKNNFEDMAYRTNMEAAKMIPLQLRLRDIGGQIVADFIEMRDKSHWREVEKTLRQGMKVDRARYDVGKIGPFGMLELVRQRLGSSAISVSTEVCPCCKGSGVRRNMEWQSQQVFKDIQRQMRAAYAQKKTELVYEVASDLAFHLLNQKRQRICDLEHAMGVSLMLMPKD